jgi:hypothetical protein
MEKLLGKHPCWNQNIYDVFSILGQHLQNWMFSCSWASAFIKSKWSWATLSPKGTGYCCDDFMSRPPVLALAGLRSSIQKWGFCILHICVYICTNQQLRFSHNFFVALFVDRYLHHLFVQCPGFFSDLLLVILGDTFVEVASPCPQQPGNFAGVKYICIYIYVYIYVYIYMYIYMCIYMYIYICIYNIGYAYIYINIDYVAFMFFLLQYQSNTYIYKYIAMPIYNNVYIYMISENTKNVSGIWYAQAATDHCLAYHTKLIQWVIYPKTV